MSLTDPDAALTESLLVRFIDSNDVGNRIADLENANVARV